MGTSEMSLYSQGKSETPDTFFFIVRWPPIMEHIFLSLGINWTIPLTVKDAYESWSLWKVDKAIKKIRIMIHLRNKRCFDGESTALGILKTRCTENLFSWTNLYPVVNAEQLQDFTNSLALA
ncbi:hypothetical protein H5410_053209 [Solanum commersonii]|uniref:Uncharacterized protein n=1 Tax=Solanum commersonii TaxID=4109 RepID=A0A9J5X5S3_SOLCO|nr:hypothetical protein H5410_053209 [Solanum commersonii]